MQLKGEFTRAMRDQPASGNIQLPAHDAFTGTPTSTAAKSYYSTLSHLIAEFFNSIGGKQIFAMRFGWDRHEPSRDERCRGCN